MKLYLGLIPPMVVIALATVAWAQNGVTVAPTQDLTSIIAGVGTGGLTIWFCLKWVQSELARNEEKLQALKESHKASLERVVALAQTEKELRLQESREYADRIKEVSQQQVTNLQLTLQAWRDHEARGIQRDPSQ